MKFPDIIHEYKRQIETGDSIAVINRFYDDAIVQIENNEAPVQGKNKLLDLEKASIERLYRFNLQIDSLVMDEAQQIVMGEMFVRFDSKKGGKKKFHEAFVQHWKNEKIVYQRFYYGAIEADE